MNNLKNILTNKSNLLTLYLTLGYPDSDKFFNALDIMVINGMDILEIGIPVENPILDGATISNTHRKVISKGLDRHIIITYLKKIKFQYPDLPIVIMSYKDGIDKYNLLDIDLYDAILCPDETIITEKKDTIQIYNEEMDMNTIKETLDITQGFAYVMSGVGKTGGKGSLPEGYIQTMENIRKVSNIPLQIGFGIHSPTQIKKVISKGANGVIIGSEIIRKLDEGMRSLELYMKEISKARG
ncbi:tryptophan synthase subunit alpha [Clostridium sp. D2Q-11]|uniref:tryptophan synthase n=1 Tax=Anaeromonas frigoriresistens TaxID=2683708 RepID=A0A942Z8D3_9FIRM|nr:tryptophan synthase subunit alpha [Anaeromonas frigoriresistens]MBS4537864.1 tryptophan synthase subunit alpha [Anaeromonas frigoriresistens]